jgi:HEAT repeat protein
MQTDLMAHGDITRQALAERIIEDNAPLAAYAIVDMVTHSDDESIRFQAAKYLLDRANGKPKTSMQLNVTESNPVMQVLEGVVVQRPTMPANDETTQGSDA